MNPEPMPTFAEDPSAAIRFFREYGYFVEPDVWSTEEIKALHAASTRLPSFLDKSCAPTMHPHRVDATFLRALANRRVVSIMEGLLGGRVSGIQTEFFHGKPGTPGFARHQDNFYVEAPRDMFASAWSPLVDVSPRNGTLIVYPGSHREPILPVEEFDVSTHSDQDVNARRLQATMPSHYLPVDVIAAAGDVVFIHGFIVHESHPNRSAEYRRVLLSTYVREGAPFRPGRNAKREAVDVYAVEQR